MGYLKRGLSIQELKKMGREIAEKGGTPRELALMIAEDNYSIHIVATQRKMLSDKNRAAILKRARELDSEDLKKYNSYIRLSLNIYKIVPLLEYRSNSYSRNYTIVRGDLTRIKQAEKYCGLVKSFYSYLKEHNREEPELKQIEEELKQMEQAIGEPYFLNSGGNIRPNYMRLYSQLKEDSARLRFNLREVLVYEAVFNTLSKNKDIADFIPDYIYELIGLTYEKAESLLTEEERKYSESYLTEQKAKLEELINNKASELLINRQEQIVFQESRFYSVVPDIETTRAQIGKSRIDSTIEQILKTDEIQTQL